jgi:hypothetical protein
MKLVFRKKKENILEINERMRGNPCSNQKQALLEGSGTMQEDLGLKYERKPED